MHMRISSTPQSALITSAVSLFHTTKTFMFLLAALIQTAGCLRQLWRRSFIIWIFAMMIICWSTARMSSSLERNDRSVVVFESNATVGKRTMMQLLVCQCWLPWFFSYYAYWFGSEGMYSPSQIGIWVPCLR
jgi:hypothetical protein